MICPHCNQERDEMEFKGRPKYKWCVSCREKQRTRRAANRAGTNVRRLPEEARYRCDYCVFENNCRLRVFFGLPVKCEKEIWFVDVYRMEVLNETQG